VIYNNFDWVLNPFVVAKTDLTGREEEFCELSSDRTLVWIKKLLHLFGWSVVDEYALLSKRQLKFYYLLWLLQSTCVRQHFQLLLLWRQNTGPDLPSSLDLQVCLSQIAPRIDQLCNKKQPHHIDAISVVHKHDLVRLEVCGILPRWLVRKIDEA